MNLKDVREQAKGYFADWIRINDDENPWTIEDFSYATGAPDSIDGHCWKCVTAKHCWFVDETDKKPIEFDYDQYSPNEIPQSKRGVYHPNCHCEKLAIPNPKAEDIVVAPLGKIDDFFNRKNGLYFAWGYSEADKQSFIDMFLRKVRESYSAGRYKVFTHDKYGIQINCYITIHGQEIKRGHS